MWRRTSPSDPITLPEGFLVAAGGKPAGHMTGDFHCKEGRQEVEWKPGLSTVSLNTEPTARPSQLSASTIRAGTEVAYCPMRAARIYVRKRFPQTA